MRKTPCQEGGIRIGCPDKISGPVFRSVVYDDNLQIAVVLGKNTVEARSNIFSAIPIQDNNGDEIAHGRTR